MIHAYFSIIYLLIQIKNAFIRFFLRFLHTISIKNKMDVHSHARPPKKTTIIKKFTTYYLISFYYFLFPYWSGLC